MKQIFWREKKEPLCHGYLTDDKIGFKVSFDFLGSLCFENPIGKNLVDFAWLDADFIKSMFNNTAGVYLWLCEKHTDYASLADGMVDLLARKYMHINCYLSMYLFGFVEFFLEGWADRRLLSNVATDAFDDAGHTLVNVDGRVFTHKHGSLIDTFVSSVTERQALVEQTLSKVLGNGEKTAQDALARFYDYECHDPLFREHWHSRFETSFGKTTEASPEIVQLSALARIDDMLRFELVQMLVQDVQYKPCSCCGKLFIPSGRSDSIYCGRIMPGHERPCSEIGANLAAKKKQETPAYRRYLQAYRRLYKRVEFCKMNPAEFAAWKAQAVPKREQCINGELPLAEFEAWLDETSRRRKKKEQL